jgi:hypothetical protein
MPVEPDQIRAMRLSPEHIQHIKSTAHTVLGEGVRIVLFKAPNLQEQPIHQIAAQQEVVL